MLWGKKFLQGGLDTDTGRGGWGQGFILVREGCYNKQGVLEQITALSHSSGSPKSEIEA